MALTKTHSQRHTLNIDGVETYRFIIQCTEKGDLPDTGVFLMKIMNERDPLEDVFDHIAEISDFDNYSNDRDIAARNGDDYWRTSLLTKDYTNLQTAASAVQAFFDRINTLATDYATYLSQFYTTGEDDEYPSETSTRVQELKAAYNTAYTDYETAQTAEAAALAALTTAESDLSTAESELTKWEDLAEAMQDRLDEMSAAHDDFLALESGGAYNAKTVIGCIDVYTAAYYKLFESDVRKLTFQSSGYTDVISTDVGKTVTGGTTGDTGTLMYYDNSTREWWVKPDDAGDLFDDTEPITISLGTGEGTTMGPSIQESGPMDPEVAQLISCRNNFNSASEAAESGVAKAQTGVDNHGIMLGDINSEIDTRETTRDTARTDVTTSQTAYNEAQGGTQTKYQALEDAYDAVKAVCPDWVPDNPFPPMP